ncbi:hypothetical protein VR41_11875 [Streptomyces sp. NRRL B-1568]|nr:hypothetical protein VR41_11875 [Streptomyces sp. NRRL B-1568]
MNAPGIRAAAVPPGTAARGGYVLSDAERGTPDVVLVADGAELRTALEARRILLRDGIATRVVAMPCPKWFDEQAPAYRDAVLPPATPRISVAAGTALGWYQLLGGAGETVGLDRFGAGAPYRNLYESRGLTPERVAAAARAAAARAPGRERR